MIAGFILLSVGALAQELPGVDADHAPPGARVVYHFPDVPDVEGILGLDARSAADFGDVLREEGDPFNARTYYRLALHLDPSGVDLSSDSLRFRMALCYEQGERWPAAEAAWLDLSDRSPDLAAASLYRAAVTQLHAGRPGALRFHTDALRADFPTDPFAERAALLGAWAALADADLDAARRELDTFAASYPGSAGLPAALAARGALDVDLRRTSPALAGALSAVIPGAGQLYAGHRGDALMAFLSNGVLAAGSYGLLRYGVEQDRAWAVGVGIPLATVAASSWFANGIGAVQGAKRANAHRARRVAEGAQGELASPWLQLRPEDVELPPISAD